MFRYFPHRGEKVRIVHNVQQAETMENIVGQLRGGDESVVTMLKKNSYFKLCAEKLITITII
jgi:hypothetical protein